MYSLLICNWAYVTCTSGSTGFNIHLALPGKIAFLSKRQLSNQCKPEHFPVKYAQIFQHNLPPKISTNFLRNRLFFCEFDSEKPGKFDFFSATYRKPWNTRHMLRKLGLAKVRDSCCWPKGVRTLGRTVMHDCVDHTWHQNVEKKKKKKTSIQTLADKEWNGYTNLTTPFNSFCLKVWMSKNVFPFKNKSI